MRYRKDQLKIAIISIAVLALIIGLAVLLNERRHPNQGEDYIPVKDQTTSEETTTQENDPVQDDIIEDNKTENDTTENDTTEDDTTEDDTTEDEEPDWSDPSKVTYADFLKMTPDQQEAFQDSFSDPADYVKWFWDAWDEYEASKN